MFDFPSSAVYAATTYGQDARGDLTSVSQRGQFRSFQCDKLSRLTDATKPESGHIGYQYDLASNFVAKTDARGVVTTFGYDALNRVRTRFYTGGSAATPIVTYNYDTAPKGVGRLASVITSGQERQHRGSGM